MIKFGESVSLLPDWLWYQWAAAGMIALLIILAGTIIYAMIFAIPGGIFFVDDGIEVPDYWREIVDRRAEVRGRITKRMVLWIGFATAMLLGAGWLVWVVW